MEHGEGKTEDIRKRPFSELDDKEMEDKQFYDMDSHDSQDETRAMQIVCDRLSALDRVVTGRQGLSARLDELEGQMADITNDFCEVRAENWELREQLKLLQAVVIKKDRKIDKLKQKLVDQKGCNMRNNIMLHGIKEN